MADGDDGVHENWEPLNIWRFMINFPIADVLELHQANWTQLRCGWKQSGHTQY